MPIYKRQEKYQASWFARNVLFPYYYVIRASLCYLFRVSHSIGCLNEVICDGLHQGLFFIF